MPVHQIVVDRELAAFTHFEATAHLARAAVRRSCWLSSGVAGNPTRQRRSGARRNGRKREHSKTISIASPQKSGPQLLKAQRPGRSVGNATRPIFVVLDHMGLIDHDETHSVEK